MTNTTFNEIKSIAKSLVPVRRHIHTHPEIGMQCQKTRDYIKRLLENMGYDVSLVGTSGLTTIVGSGKNPVFLLRADIDALLISEDNDLDFKSSHSDKMHGCGHDLHTTMLLGAAQYLKNHESEIEGTIKFMFQPGEETMQGAKDMIDNGILQNPMPQAGMMVHVAPDVPFDVGSFIFLNDGPAMASVDWFDIKIKGKGGHGSTPYMCIDPLVPASTIIQALQSIQTRELPPNALTSLTVGSVHGLDGSNIIADELTLGGTLRTYDETQRKFIKERIVDISTNISKAFRCISEVTFPVGAPTLLNSEEITQVAYDALKPYVGAEHLIKDIPNDTPVMGSEDFAYISQEIPITSVLVVASDSRAGETYPLHHPKLVFDEKAIEYGILAYTQTALSWLKINQ